MVRSSTPVPVCGTVINFFLDPEFGIERYVLANGTWEKLVTQLISHLVGSGDVCLNVGANFGYHTLGLAHQVGYSGKVIAFEPNDRIKDRLIANCENNPNLRNQIEIHSKALGSEHGHFKLFEVPGNGNAYIAKDFSEQLGGESNTYTEVEVVKFDDYMNLSRLDFILVDIEGMEPNFFIGAENHILKHRPIILYETLIEHFSDSVKKSEKFLLERDYVLMALHPSLGKLIPVKYPDYLTDAIAIPKEKAGQVLDILANAYLFDLFIEENEKLILKLGILPEGAVIAEVESKNKKFQLFGRLEDGKLHLINFDRSAEVRLELNWRKSHGNTLDGHLIMIETNTSRRVRGCLTAMATPDPSVISAYCEPTHTPIIVPNRGSRDN